VGEGGCQKNAGGCAQQEGDDGVQAFAEGEGD